MPFPTIEVACGSIGGMSGGALLDETGFLLGETSRGVTSEDGLGPTFVAWVVGALNRELEIPWPPGIYPQPVHLLDINQWLLLIEGRDHVRAVDANRVEHELWFDRSRNGTWPSATLLEQRINQSRRCRYVRVRVRPRVALGRDIPCAELGSRGRTPHG